MYSSLVNIMPQSQAPRFSTSSSSVLPFSHTLDARCHRESLVVVQVRRPPCLVQVRDDRFLPRRHQHVLPFLGLFPLRKRKTQVTHLHGHSVPHMSVGAHLAAPPAVDFVANKR